MVFVTLMISYQLLSAQVSEQQIRDHVHYLASKELNGRIAGTPEGRKAAQYIVEQLQASGCCVFTDTSGYYQDFTRTRRDAKPSKLIGATDTIGIAHLNKHLYLRDKQSIKLVSQEDVTKDARSDSNIFVMLHAKRFDDGMQRIKEDQRKHGGKNGYMLLLPSKKQKGYRINLKHLKKANNVNEVFVLTNYLHYARNKEACEAYLEEFADLNVLVSSEKSLTKVLDGNIESQGNLELVEAPDSIIVNNYWNVIAKIEGSDPEKPAIVFCAHYDHVDSLSSRKTKGEALTDYFPGADDNASGTAAVIEVAKTLKKANYQPKQTIYFCLFDAEEQGLYGSRHFAKTIGKEVDLVINMDMIGRDKRDRKGCQNVIFGKSQGETGKEFVKGFDKYVKNNSDFLKIRRFDTELLLILFGFPSDQASFRPDSDTSIFYTGLHKDYHTHNDVAEKINYKKLTKYINLMSQYLMQYN
jgi:hypothetical protein